MIFTTGLLIYHTSLIVKNLTTKEELKRSYKNNFGNPHRRSCCENFRRIFFGNIPKYNLLHKIKLKIELKELKVIKIRL